ncbi:2749_t:CDS:2 [Paraglomus occultum]|uniref:2749_t:CDS:1 n=1 Tax=Paraglomus occultum TaxID=144539 RepID=A0A9N8VYN2_9GLOM|nr:2749_t:CDS:2 [Paraglomus occultum]
MAKKNKKRAAKQNKRKVVASKTVETPASETQEQEQTKQGRRNKNNRNGHPRKCFGLGISSLRQQLKELGLYLKDIAGDGNCLFRALSDQYYGSPGKHAKIRSEVCDYLAANKKHFKHFVEEDRFDDHIAQMRKLGTYGGNMELVGYAQLQRVNIRVYQPGTIYVISGNDFDSKESSKKLDRNRKTLHIAYHNWEHYSSVRNIRGPHDGDPEITLSEEVMTKDRQISKENLIRATSERKYYAEAQEVSWVLKIRRMREDITASTNVSVGADDPAATASPVDIHLLISGAFMAVDVTISVTSVNSHDAI